MIDGFAPPIRFAIGFFTLVSLAWAGPRVAVSVTADKDAELWQSVLTAGLNQAAPDAEIVERTELARLWRERETAALNASAAPAPLNIDRYVHFRQTGGTHWIVTLVDAISSRDLGALSVDAVDPSDADHLARAAAQLLETPAPEVNEHAGRIAVVENAQSADASLFALASRLRTTLSDAGLVVADRALTQELVVEQNDATRGFRAHSPTGELLGLDHWVELTPLEARLVRARDGIVIGILTRDTRDPAEVEVIRRWLLPLLGKADEAPASSLPQVETEALEPFYRGLTLYESGQYIEAVSEFTRAYLANDRFIQAYEWEARCYEALEMPQMADAVRRFLNVGQVENMIAASARTETGASIAFAGVTTGGDASLAPLAETLSASVASVLVERNDIDLRLPDQLVRLRREYDWMSGGSATSGPRWEQAPSLFSRTAVSARLERVGDRVRLSWQLRDLVSNEVRTGPPLTLANDPSTWPEQINTSVNSWKDFAALSAKPDRVVRTAVSSEKIKLLATAFARSSGLAMNEARLELAFADPGNPVLQARGFEKGSLHQIESFTDILEYAFRDWRISQLPPESETRRWLELERAREHIGPYSIGESRRGSALDGEAELARLAAPPRTDAPGLLARHFQLYAIQAQMPPDQLNDACDELLADLNSINAAIIPEYKLLLTQVTALARTARLAAGRVPEDEPFVFTSQNPEPRQLTLKWQRDGNPLLTGGTYRVSMRYLDRQTQAQRITAARFALAVNGRTESDVDPRWLTDFPDTLEVSGPISRMLSEIDFSGGLPIRYPLEPERRREYLLAVIHYNQSLIERWLARTPDTTMLRQMDNVAGNFFHILQGHTLRELISEEEYGEMKQRAATAFDEAIERVGKLPGGNWSKVIDWRDLTREKALEMRRDILRYTSRWVMNVPALEREFTEEDAKLGNRPEGTPFDLPAWWTLMRNWRYEYTFTAPEIAALYAKRTPEALAFVHQPGKVALKDAQALFEQALWLHYGRREVEAQQLYQGLLDLKSGMSDSSIEWTELQANCAFRLAQIAHCERRIPEAMALASQALEMCADASPRMISQRYTYKWNDNVLRNNCVRLLRELRLDPERLSLPPRTHVVRVPTENGDNPIVSVFFRLPPPSQTVKPGNRRVLVLSPINNQEALVYLRQDCEWARFADAHNLVLVVPQFYASDAAMKADHRFTHSRYAQIWSGRALLNALDQISRITPIESGNLLMHGDTSGGGFATNFAAWRPDLVSAVSVINGNWSMPRTSLPGLTPRSEWRKVRYHIAAGELDNYRGDGGVPRYDTSVDFVTRLMGDGVPVEWKSWPEVYHEPTVEMEEEARAFIARQLKP